jgi:signal transduction histidine kinase
MTRTRIAALRLFLERLANNVAPSFEMADAARTTIAELESITEALMTVGHAKSQSRSLPLREVLGDIEANYTVKPRLDIEQSAREALVPASQFHLLIDELVRNAINAVNQKSDPIILIKASIRRRLLWGPQLVLIVMDNGIGMNPSTLAKAREPFFSTKAGVHVGLGLTNCAEMVKTMAGTLKITSVPGDGTTVRVTYSL